MGVFVRKQVGVRIRIFEGILVERSQFETSGGVNFVLETVKVGVY